MASGGGGRRPSSAPTGLTINNSISNNGANTMQSHLSSNARSKSNGSAHSGVQSSYSRNLPPSSQMGEDAQVALGTSDDTELSMIIEALGNDDFGSAPVSPNPPPPPNVKPPALQYNAQQPQTHVSGVHSHASSGTQRNPQQQLQQQQQHTPQQQHYGGQSANSYPPLRTPLDASSARPNSPWLLSQTSAVRHVSPQPHLVPSTPLTNVHPGQQSPAWGASGHAASDPNVGRGGQMHPQQHTAVQRTVADAASQLPGRTMGGGPVPAQRTYSSLSRGSSPGPTADVDEMRRRLEEVVREKITREGEIRILRENIAQQEAASREQVTALHRLREEQNAREDAIRKQLGEQITLMKREMDGLHSQLAFKVDEAKEAEKTCRSLEQKLRVYERSTQSQISQTPVANAGRGGTYSASTHAGFDDTDDFFTLATSTPTQHVATGKRKHGEMAMDAAMKSPRAFATPAHRPILQQPVPLVGGGIQQGANVVASTTAVRSDADAATNCTSHADDVSLTHTRKLLAGLVGLQRMLDVTDPSAGEEGSPCAAVAETLALLGRREAVAYRPLLSLGAGALSDSPLGFNTGAAARQRGSDGLPVHLGAVGVEPTVGAYIALLECAVLDPHTGISAARALDLLTGLASSCPSVRARLCRDRSPAFRFSQSIHDIGGGSSNNNANERDNSPPALPRDGFPALLSRPGSRLVVADAAWLEAHGIRQPHCAPRDEHVGSSTDAMDVDGNLATQQYSARQDMSSSPPPLDFARMLIERLRSLHLNASAAAGAVAGHVSAGLPRGERQNSTAVALHRAGHSALPTARSDAGVTSSAAAHVPLVRSAFRLFGCLAGDLDEAHFTALLSIVGPRGSVHPRTILPSDDPLTCEGTLSLMCRCVAVGSCGVETILLPHGAGHVQGERRAKAVAPGCIIDPVARLLAGANMTPMSGRRDHVRLLAVRLLGALSRSGGESVMLSGNECVCGMKLINHIVAFLTSEINVLKLRLARYGHESEPSAMEPSLSPHTSPPLLAVPRELRGRHATQQSDAVFDVLDHAAGIESTGECGVSAVGDTMASLVGPALREGAILLATLALSTACRQEHTAHVRSQVVVLAADLVKIFARAGLVEAEEHARDLLELWLPECAEAVGGGDSMETG